MEANILNLYCNNYNENKGVELKRPEYLNIDATFFDESEYFDDSIFEILGLSNDYKKVWNLL